MTQAVTRLSWGTLVFAAAAATAVVAMNYIFVSVIGVGGFVSLLLGLLTFAVWGTLVVYLGWWLSPRGLTSRSGWKAVLAWILAVLVVEAIVTLISAMIHYMGIRWIADPRIYIMGAGVIGLLYACFNPAIEATSQWRLEREGRQS